MPTNILGFLPYLLLCLIASAILLINEIFQTTKKIKTILFVFLFFAIFLLAIFKEDSVGIDTIAYRTIYYELQENPSLPMGGDFGFYFLMVLFGKLGFPFFFFQCFYYLVVNLIFGTCFWSFSKKPFVVTLVFISSPCFTLYLSGLRQIGAIAFCLLAALMFLKGKKGLKYLAIVVWLFSCTLHFSAFIFVLFFLFHFVPAMKENFVLYFAVFYIFFFFFGNYVYDFLNRIYDTGYPLTSLSLGLPFYSLFLIIIFFSIFFLLFTPFIQIEKRILDKENYFFLLAFFLAACIMSLSSHTTYMTRFSFYFFPFIGLTIANSIGNLKLAKTRIIFSVVICVFFSFLTIYETSFTNSCGTYPYLWRF